jgi:hypothetical protein
VKLWLDDQWDDPEAPKRHPPEGWTPVKTVQDAIALITAAGDLLEAVSLDNDLGTPEEGFRVLDYIEDLVHERKLSRISLAVHSVNGVRKEYMRKLIARINQMWDDQETDG